MDKIVQHLTANFGKHFAEELDLEIAELINCLNREERGELRYRLFNEARLLDKGTNGQQALFWLQNCFELIDKYMFRMHKVFFSPGTDILDSIADMLRQAQNSLDVCVFTITDERLSGELLACHQRGVKVRIITDDNKMFDHGSAIKELNDKGIPVRIDHSEYHMHHKFGIIDSRIVFTGSFNWTYTASKHNQENLLVTTNYDIVAQFTEQYEQLWNEMFSI